MAPSENITLKFLGSGDAFSSGGRFNTCFYVSSPEYRFLIDCGATSLAAIRQNNIEAFEIDAVLLSHFHGDHFGGLPFILLDAQYVQKRTKKLVIAGPVGVRVKVKRLLGLLYPGIRYQDFSYRIEFIEYRSGEETAIGPLKVMALPVVHSEEASPHGLRIKVNNKLIAFSGDSAWTEKLVDLSEKADLFICECNFFEKETKGHLNYKTLQQHKHRFSCKRLILNHLDIEMLENLSKVEIETAYDGLEIEI